MSKIVVKICPKPFLADSVIQKEKKTVVGEEYRLAVGYRCKQNIRLETAGVNSKNQTGVAF